MSLWNQIWGHTLTMFLRYHIHKYRVDKLTTRNKMSHHQRRKSDCTSAHVTTSNEICTNVRFFPRLVKGLGTQLSCDVNISFFFFFIFAYSTNFCLLRIRRKRLVSKKGIQQLTTSTLDLCGADFGHRCGQHVWTAVLSPFPALWPHLSLTFYQLSKLLLKQSK